MENAARITVEAYTQALQALDEQNRIAERQRQMLMVHYHAPDRVITATELAEAVGYKGHRGINLWYGKLAKSVAEDVGYQPPEGYTYLSTLVTFKKEAIPYPMRLRPNVVKALEALGWV
jgi:hypothetical protein